MYKKFKFFTVLCLILQNTQSSCIDNENKTLLGSILFAGTTTMAVGLQQWKQHQIHTKKQSHTNHDTLSKKIKKNTKLLKGIHNLQPQENQLIQDSVYEQHIPKPISVNIGCGTGKLFRGNILDIIAAQQVIQKIQKENRIIQQEFLKQTIESSSLDNFNKKNQEKPLLLKNTAERDTPDYKTKQKLKTCLRELRRTVPVHLESNPELNPTTILPYTKQWHEVIAALAKLKTLNYGKAGDFNYGNTKIDQFLRKHTTKKETSETITHKSITIVKQETFQPKTESPNNTHWNVIIHGTDLSKISPIFPSLQIFGYGDGTDAAFDRNAKIKAIENNNIVENFIVQWSGELDQNIRKSAGQDLSEYLQTIMTEESYPDTIDVITHSHGGNVGRHAIEHFTKTLLRKFKGIRIRLISLASPAGDIDIKNYNIPDINFYGKKDGILQLANNGENPLPCNISSINIPVAIENQACNHKTIRNIVNRLGDILTTLDSKTASNLSINISNQYHHKNKTTTTHVKLETHDQEQYSFQQAIASELQSAGIHPDSLQSKIFQYSLPLIKSILQQFTPQSNNMHSITSPPSSGTTSPTESTFSTNFFEDGCEEIDPQHIQPLEGRKIKSPDHTATYFSERNPFDYLDTYLSGNIAKYIRTKNSSELFEFINTTKSIEEQTYLIASIPRHMTNIPSEFNEDSPEFLEEQIEKLNLVKNLYTLPKFEALNQRCNDWQYESEYMIHTRRTETKPEWDTTKYNHLEFGKKLLQDLRTATQACDTETKKIAVIRHILKNSPEYKNLPDYYKQGIHHGIKDSQGGGLNCPNFTI